MKISQVVLIGILISCFVAGAGASVTENFQSWGSDSVTCNTGATCSITNTGSAVGNISLSLSNGFGTYYVININPVTFNYAAFDMPVGSEYGPTAYLFDSSMNQISALRWSPGYNNRNEIVISAGTPKLYVNGVLYSTGTDVASNPMYLGIGGYGDSHAWGVTVDNIVIGGTDHHVVGALPSNWSIIRDLLDPASTGTYAWNNATQAWVLKNSNYFYLDADTSSQDGYGIEYFDIICDTTGNIVNTTTINSTASQKNQIQYNIAQFLATSTGTYTSLPDGSYTAEFRNYPLSAQKFWVISQGAAIAWNQVQYPTGGTATITYSISTSYWDTTTYSYSIKTVDIYGNTIDTYSLTSKTGTQSVSLTDTKYPAGVYYAEIIATKLSDSSAYIINYAATETTAYVYVSGYIMNEVNAVGISGAKVNVTQSSTTVSYTSDSSGAWGNYTQYWLTGSEITLSTNKSGYKDYSRSFSALSAGNIVANISLEPTNKSYVGIYIDGVVSNSKYGNPISGATVYKKINGTSDTPDTNITNMAGYYNFGGLINGTVYDLWSSKTGFRNSTMRQITAVGG